jgi:superfamily I DNA/RNA helicase
LEQENFAKSLGEGHHLIRGVAGSGKTLVLTYRAKYLHELHPSWRILLVCYNVSFKKYLEKLVHHQLRAGVVREIYVHNFHELVKKVSGSGTAPFPNESSDDYDARIGRQLQSAIDKGSIIGGKFDAILIDEAQDFSTDWLRGVVRLLNNNDTLAIALDPAQDVYGRKRIWREAGVDVVGGKRSRKLKQSYRNTTEILRLAVKFQGFENYLELEPGASNDNLDDIIQPEDIGRHGDRVAIPQLPDRTSMFSNIASRIEGGVAKGEFTYRDCAILSCSYDLSKYIQSNPNFLGSIPISLVLNHTQKREFDPEGNTVKCLNVESSKGLEWKMVFLVGVEDMPRGGRIEKHERNLVYIGITRAQNSLMIPHVKQNAFVQDLVKANG